MDWAVFVLLTSGLILLVAGAELLVRGASRLARSVGISPLVVGLTVVALGTSSPELAVSIQSAVAGRADLAVGNVVGSNIFNVLFILGASSLITPLLVSRQLLRLDVPVMVGASVLVFVLASDGTIGRLEGATLFAGIIGYTSYLARLTRRQQFAAADMETRERPEKGAWPVLRNSILMLVGLGLLVLGSRWFVAGAVEVATFLGVSDLVIGLTVVAVGTSLPEVATSIVATIRGERDIAVGNVVGSNIFNLLAVLGLTGLLAPDGVAVADAAVRFDFPVMIAVALVCVPIFVSGNRIVRWEGALLLGYYAVYSSYIIIQTAGHPALPAFRTSMNIVLPLTAITLLFVSVRAPRLVRSREL